MPSFNFQDYILAEFIIWGAAVFGFVMLVWLALALARMGRK